MARDPEILCQKRSTGSRIPMPYRFVKDQGTKLGSRGLDLYKGLNGGAGLQYGLPGTWEGLQHRSVKE